MEEVKIYPVCKRCGRKLKNSDYREIGMGKICLEKSRVSTSDRSPLFGTRNIMKENNYECRGNN